MIKIENYLDLKCLAIKQGIGLTYELPRMLGYKRDWCLKKALKNPCKKTKILKKAEAIFLSNLLQKR